MHKLLAAVAAACLTACAAAPGPTPAGPERTGGSGPPPGFAEMGEVSALADRYVALVLQSDPTAAYGAGLPAPDHRRWADNRPEALRALEGEFDLLLQRLDRVHPAAVPPGVPTVTYALLREELEAERQGRVCRSELWDVNHMWGWHRGLVRVADEQPVTDAGLRTQALERWSALPQVVDVEIANLRAGLAAGYSSPKTVVTRVISQVDGLAPADPEASPLFSPGKRSDDPAFKAAFRTVIAEQVNPALRRYRDFLKTEYLPQARDSIAVSALPDGLDCYRASLRGFTTLDRSPEEVYALGERTVAANAARVVEIGESTFGTRDLAAIVKRTEEAPDNQFASEAEVVAFAKDAVERAKAKTAPLFNRMPTQPMLAEPFLPYMRGSGASAHYERQADLTKPAYYRINSETWENSTRAGGEITAFHEGYPGHHMQIAFAQSLQQTPLAKLTSNSAYTEGWARYAEMLAEEGGMYDSDYALITRRIWPARGMVVDPGIHVLGWSRRQAQDYLIATGRFSEKESADMVDRIAIIPGQLTAYDSGGLEIMALREEAKRELGDRFDLRDFHDAVLNNGVVPLGQLRRQVREWIAAEKAGRTPG